MNKIELEFHQFSKTLDGSTAVGLSGGSDSVALVYLAQNFIKDFDVVFFSHGDNPLVGDDTEAVELCKKICKDLGKTLHIVELDLEKSRAGWEASGHKARKNYAMTHYDNFLLGHHLDDVCENYFIQLMRGAGSARVLKSEATMKRPLLKFSKEEIKTYLTERNITWVEDTTNDNTDITRNYWRQVVLPQIEQHYPQYRSRMATAVAVEQQNMTLLKDLAVLDGLDNFVANNKINVKLSDTRLSSLLYFYFKEKKISVQRPKLEEFIKQIARPQKVITSDLLGPHITVTKTSSGIDLSLTLQKKPKP